ncbi:hypothetical protein O1611_g10019 [Lasiodiplodia mahajangana]|uniref:Uncharacterized protein n=1 Tax=Lasiodiplodia mahajangana TaxID=1108764 RepID=A0ACC2J3H7_9PEZI|nr:hypothetical protein O1611_g10019 [Lasiodiplodia mahajangana]
MPEKGKTQVRRDGPTPVKEKSANTSREQHPPNPPFLSAEAANFLASLPTHEALVMLAMMNDGVLPTNYAGPGT